MYRHNGVCTLLMDTILAAAILKLPLLMKMKRTDKCYSSKTGSNILVHILGRHGSVSLCRVERENKMAATYNVLAFKR